MCHDCGDGPYGHSRHPYGDRPHRRGWDDGPDRDFDRRPDRDLPRDECDCDCHDRDDNDLGFERRFVSKAETLEALEWYLQELQNEAQGVKEAISDLRKEMAEASTPAEPPPAPAGRSRSRKK